MNVSTVQVPLFGGIPVDGNLVLLIPVANISDLVFSFSILVVTFNVWDYIDQKMSKIEPMKMEYTPMVVNEGTFQGLCSNQMQWPATVSVATFHLLPVPSCMHHLKPLGQPFLILVKLNIF